MLSALACPLPGPYLGKQIAAKCKGTPGESGLEDAEGARGAPKRWAILPAAGPSPTAFTGLAVGPEAQSRETLLSPPFGEAAGNTAPNSSPLFRGDRVAGWWDPTMAACGGRREVIKQLARTACPVPTPLRLPFPHACVGGWTEQGRAGLRS